MSNVLIIDDDRMLCDMMSQHLRHMEHDVTCSLTLTEGIHHVNDRDFDVVYLDVFLPDGNGLDALPRIREAASAPEVIIFTADGTPDGAELAIRSGAWDYVEKPASIESMTLPLVRALQYREERKKGRPAAALRRAGIVGNSAVLRKGLDLVAKAAGSEASVLITGETGTGKELFAHAIHENSARASRDFVVVDCAALPETLVESVLFGHERGAFTGAEKARPGLVKQADGGTLFLDEVGELPLSVQKIFLRVLQEHRFRPVGGGREVQSDFRLVAATNRDLAGMVRAGRFRSDLLFRLESIHIPLPPLRERCEDIKDLVLYFLTKLCEHRGIGPKGFSPEFLESLTRYDWPGNVRELSNALERALSVAHHEPTLFAMHLPSEIRVQVARAAVEQKAEASPGHVGPPSATADPLPELRTLLARTEQAYLRQLLSLTQGDIREACAVSGLSRSRLYERLKRYGITRSS